MKKQYISIITLVCLSLIVTALVYNKLPASVASHWNAKGEVDGYMGRNENILFFYGFMIGLPLLLTFIPKLDPKYSNIKSFEETYLWFVVGMSGFFTALYYFSLAWSLGYEFPMNYFIIPAMGLLFFGIGKLIDKSELNYTIGIRTPWTLSSEANWKATHKLASKLFIWSAPLTFLCALLGNYAYIGFMIVISSIAIIPVGYSYWFFRTKQK